MKSYRRDLLGIIKTDGANNLDDDAQLGLLESKNTCGEKMNE